MNPYYKDDLVTIFHADCREILPSIQGVSAVVTDPPYGLEFMGKEWDKFENNRQRWIGKERKLVGNGSGKGGDFGERFNEMPHSIPKRNKQCVICGHYSFSGTPCKCENPKWEIDTKYINAYREFCFDWASLLKDICLPGAMLLSFGGTRTSHRLACAIEDAGWQIRDTICWVYGSGFPKSLDISKAIDKQAGEKREVIGVSLNDRPNSQVASGKAFDRALDKGQPHRDLNITAPATPEAKLWEGYGTALKPAYEPIILAMKPLEGTFANNALKHKVAGLNIDASRIETADNLNGGGYDPEGKSKKDLSDASSYATKPMIKEFIQPKGRFPSNFIHDGSQEVMELFPNSKSQGGICNGHNGSKSSFGIPTGRRNVNPYAGDSGSAARFFYCAKSSRRERDAGLEDMPKIQIGLGRYGVGEHKSGGISSPQPNPHPTVKPLSLMTYLCKLVKMPEYNLILDPFCGSGTTLLACKKLGIPCIGIESSEEYCEIAKKRVNAL